MTETPMQIKTLTEAAAHTYVEQLVAMDHEVLNLYDEQWEKSNFLRFAENKWILSQYSVEKDLVSGFLVASANETTSSIHRFAVRNEQQGRGLGSLLLEAFELACEEQGVREITLSTKKNNAATLRFYRSKGYNLLETNKEIEEYLSMKEKLDHLPQYLPGNPEGLVIFKKTIN